MDYKELRDQIEHARSLAHPVPPRETADIKELLHKRASDERPYLVYRNGTGQRVELSYKEFIEEVKGCALFLKDHGLRRGDRIATISHNHWQTVIQYFAAWVLGLVVVPVNLDEDDERIAFILEKAEVELAFLRSEYQERVLNILERYDSLKHIETVICEAETGNFCKKEGQLQLEEGSYAESDALVVFTSGTTGEPKGVVLSQRNLLEDAAHIAEWHGVNEDSRMMCVLPIHHVNGTVVTLLTPFYAGGSVVLNRRFQTKRFFPIIAEEGIHFVSVVPTLLQFLNHYYEEGDKPDTSSLHHLICGAGPLTVQTAETFEERFEVPVIHGYGLSETTCYSCFIPLDLSKEEHEKWRSDFGYPSIGVPLPANEMAIHNKRGQPVSEGERGEIVIRGVNVMTGYYKNKEANEKAFKYGWFRSGDEGFYKRDDQGRPFYFITGRLKEVIIRGGVNLAPLEIDEVINKAPGVKAGIAVGFENEWYGEEVGAFVEPEEGAGENEEAILQYCRQHLSFNKAPKVAVFGKQIPVTSTGKYQRRKVRHLFEEWKATQFREERKGKYDREPKQ